jgi:cytidylate kinase
MKSIIILSGPVGAGKSTVAKELIAISPEEIAYIEGDIFREFIAKNESHHKHKNFKTIMTAMIAASVAYAIADYEVILDFTVPPWFIDTARTMAGEQDVPIDYVVLRPDLNVCEKRAASKTKGAIADYEPFLDLYLDFDDIQENVIEDNSGDAVSVAEGIRTGLTSRRFRI